MIQSLRTAIRRVGRTMDRATVGAYDAGAAGFAKDWHDQPAPVDLHALVKRFFHPGRTADVGCGSGREVAFLAANGFDAVGYDASDALLEQPDAIGRGFHRLVGTLDTLLSVDERAPASVDGLCGEALANGAEFGEDRR